MLTLLLATWAGVWPAATALATAAPQGVPLPAEAGVGGKNAREATLTALHRCFVQQVRHHHRTQAAAQTGKNGGDGNVRVEDPPPPGGPDAGPPADRPFELDQDRPVDLAPLGPGAELFFFDQLASAEKELGGSARLLWCRPWFSGPYLRAQGVLSRRSRVARSQAHPAEPNARRTHHFNHHNDATRVLRAATHAGGQHPQAQQAHLVLEALHDGGGGPTHADADWLAVTTLVPELYLFDAPHAHAYTPATGRAPTLPEIERARLRFVEHVRQTVADARAADANGRHDRALLFVGVAAHALEDLTVHRGMTEAEHAALTYSRKENPDAVYANAGEPVLNAALATLFARVWPQGPSTQVQPLDHEARPPKTRALRKLVGEAYPFAKELDFLALLGRWRQAYTYAPRGQSPADEATLAAARAGRWDVAATLEQVWRAPVGQTDPRP